MKPLQGRALVRRHDEEKGEYTTPGGVIVPSTVTENPRKHRKHRGTIVALGPPGEAVSHRSRKRYIIPWDCKVGDVVWYSFGIALEKVRAFEEDDGRYVVVGQDEVHAVFEGESCP